MTTLQTQIVKLALSYKGQKEISGKNGNESFADPVFLKKMFDYGWQRGWAWCSIFAELVWGEVYKTQIQFPEKHQLVRKLITPSAVQSFNNFKEQKMTTDKPVEGALVFWRNGFKWTGHVGIVVETNIASKYFYSIEGNTNHDGSRDGDLVWKKKRNLDFTQKPSGLNLLGFVHPF